MIAPMSAADLAQALGGKRVGKGFMAACPAHDDRNPSLSIDDGDKRTVVHCQAGCSQEEVIDALRGRGLWPATNGHSHAKVRARTWRTGGSGERATGPQKASLGQIVATYDYVDEQGEILFQSVRYEPKSFRQRRPDGKGGWIWDLEGVRPVLFRLPEALAAVAKGATIYVVEGEKDVLTLERLRFRATCNAAGALKFRIEHAEPLRGADVVIICDNDDVGRQHGESVAHMLWGVAKRVRIIWHLPNVPEKGDITDWLGAEPSAAAFADLVDECAEEWSPPPTTDGLDEEDYADDDAPPAYSEDAIASEFSLAHADDRRFVATWNSWLSWSGTRWMQDRTVSVFEDARQVCRAAAVRVANDAALPETTRRKWPVVLASAKTVAAVERLARSDPRHSATAEQWDADPMLLNTPGGMVDLRSGALRPCAPADHMTKSTAVAPDRRATIPTWLALLEHVTEGDAELLAYLQRLFGYLATGEVREHVLPFLCGLGGSGKSTTINVIAGVLGDYATAAPPSLLVESHGERHPTELAMLQGIRLAVANETEEGALWAEAKLKVLTGGDPISARYMRGDFFTFRPTHKLVVIGNHRPQLRNPDEAMRRRFHLIPFDRQVPADRRDQRLGEKLRAEWPGILAWIVEGARLWSQIGLRPPEAVTQATEGYMEDQDTFGLWVSECCHRGQFLRSKSGLLYQHFRMWKSDRGEHVPSQKRFMELIRSRLGIQSRKSDGIMVLDGIELSDEAVRELDNARDSSQCRRAARGD